MDRLLKGLLGRVGISLLPFRLLQRAGGQDSPQAARILACLRRTGLVDDDGKAPGRKLADLVHDHRKLLQRGDDDCFSNLQRLLELTRGGVDVLDHPQRLFELAHCALQLAVEHLPVGDDDDGVENAPVIGVV